MRTKQNKIPTTKQTLDFDQVAQGLSQYIYKLGYRNCTVIGTQNILPKKRTLLIASNEITFNFTYNGKKYTKDTHAWYSELKNGHFERLFLKECDIQFNARVLIGKFKDSVGRINGFDSIDFGEHPISGRSLSIPLLSGKSLAFTDDTVHVVSEDESFESIDSFGNTNELMDVLVWVDNGKLAYGTFVAMDIIKKELVIRGSKGQTVTLRIGRDILNSSKMNETTMRTNILKGQLGR